MVVFVFVCLVVLFYFIFGLSLTLALSFSFELLLIAFCHFFASGQKRYFSKGEHEREQSSTLTCKHTKVCMFSTWILCAHFSNLVYATGHFMLVA